MFRNFIIFLSAICLSGCVSGPGQWGGSPVGYERGQARARLAPEDTVPVQEKLRELRARWTREPIPIGTNRQVFYDDAIIAKKHLVKRKLGRVRKLNDGQPVLINDRRWERHANEGAMVGVGPYFSVLRAADGMFRAWYTCGPAHDCIGYAESEDGIHWEKPGWNTVFGPMHGFGVSYDRHDTCSGHSYKMIYSDYHPGGGCYPPARFVHSKDGRSWRKYSENEDIGEEYDFRVDTQKSLFWDEDIERYRICARTSVKTRARGVKQFTKRSFGGTLPFLAGFGLRSSRSETKGIVEVIQDESAPGGGQSYSFNIHKYGDIYIGNMTYFVGDSLFFCVAVSRDGVHWNWDWLGRDNSLIPLGAPGAFDGDSIWCAGTPFIRDGDRILVYYAGSPWGHSRRPMGMEGKQRFNIGVAEMRLDGLFCLQPSGVEGWVETKAFELEGSVLEVNADASLGELCVGILDADGNPILGYSSDEMDKMLNDEIHHRVTWHGTSDLSSLKGRIVKLRFNMVGPVKLYAFQVLTSRDRLGVKDEERLTTNLH